MVYHTIPRAGRICFPYFSQGVDVYACIRQFYIFQMRSSVRVCPGTATCAGVDGAGGLVFGSSEFSEIVGTACR